MKRLKICIFVILTILTINISYPQAMLKTICITEDNSNIEIVDKVYKSKNNYLDINVIIPQIKWLNNNKQEKIINDKIIKWTQLWIGDAKGIADEYFKDNPSPLISYQLYARYKITNKDDIISFYIDYYQFTGGAHGITNRVAYNIDVATGNELKLEDIFKKDFLYKDVINNEISRQIKKDPDRYFTGKDGFNGINENQNFYIKNKKLVIYFELYEIAPYASGISEFVIPNKIIKENMKYYEVL